MKVLCIGGHSDGKYAEINSSTREGHRHVMSYRVPFDVDDCSTSEPMPSEAYELHYLACGPTWEERIPILTFEPGLSVIRVLETLIDGYRKGEQI